MEQQYITGQLSLQAEQEHDFLHSSTKLALELAQSLETMDLDKYQELNASPFVDVLEPYVTENFEILKLYLAVHVADCIRAVCEHGLPANITENLKKAAFSRIVAARRREDLGEIMKDLLKDLASSYRKYSVNAYSFLVQRAIEYMHTQRFQPLTPGSVAEYLQVERTNLSKRFHQETGMTMTDYIHTMKMDLADSMIRSRNYSLREICDLLGYSNYSYFCQLYKKYKHCLPGKTRRPGK